MPATFGELRDQMEEALQARDHDQWCRLFDFYRRGIPESFGRLRRLSRYSPGWEHFRATEQAIRSLKAGRT